MTDSALSRLRDRHGSDLSLAHLVEAGFDRLPLPASGGTLQRWRRLADVAALDLPLVKLFEGHTDALAIHAELAAPLPGAAGVAGADGVAGDATTASRWGTWCAEQPTARLELSQVDGRAGAAGPNTPIRLNGAKAWCSGAVSLTHAVVSAFNAAGDSCLAAVALHQPGVTITNEGWHAVGMAATGSVNVRFEDAAGVQIGAPGDYVRRAGFWQGGAGIAACWWGGAWGIAQVARAVASTSDDPHRRAHLGAIDVALVQAAALLRETASWIDAHPMADARIPALRARLAVERAAIEIIERAARVTGAGPLCRDAAFARRMADLPVFLRQSHGERDLASLGSTLPTDGAATDGVASKAMGWTL